MPQAKISRQFVIKKLKFPKNGQIQRILGLLNGVIFLFFEFEWCEWCEWCDSYYAPVANLIIISTQYYFIFIKIWTLVFALKGHFCQKTATSFLSFAQLRSKFGPPVGPFGPPNGRP